MTRSSSDTSTIEFEQVSHIAPQVLNYATWKATRQARPPPHLLDAIESLAALNAADAALATAFGAQTWATVWREFDTTIVIKDTGSPATHAMLKRIRDDHPWLDSATYDDLCYWAWFLAMR